MYGSNTHLPFRSITRTEHSPLGWLQRSRTRYFPGFFKLRINTCHHTKCRNIRKSRQHLRNSMSFHFKSFDRPITLFNIFFVCNLILTYFYLYTEFSYLLTDDMAKANPLVIWSCLICFTISNCAALIFGIFLSAICFNCKH